MASRSDHIPCVSSPVSEKEVKSHGFTKSERLFGKSAISSLISQGRWGSTDHLRYCWMQGKSSQSTHLRDKQLASQSSEEQARLIQSPDKQQDYLAANNRILVSVSKKCFKRAVKRNLLKRRIREAYRLNKQILKPQSINFMVSYISKDVLDFDIIEAEMQQILAKIQKLASIKAHNEQ